ncbi:unnamed protein product, partial [Ixodes pacificus]
EARGVIVVNVFAVAVGHSGRGGRRRRRCPGLKVDVGAVAGIVVAAPDKIESRGIHAAPLPHLQQLRSGPLWPPGLPRRA